MYSFQRIAERNVFVVDWGPTSISLKQMLLYRYGHTDRCELFNIEEVTSHTSVKFAFEEESDSGVRLLWENE
jgi:hypothetical protein